MAGAEPPPGSPPSSPSSPSSGASSEGGDPATGSVTTRATATVAADDWSLPLSFSHARHSLPRLDGGGAPAKGGGGGASNKGEAASSWRIREKYKTHCVALVVCLNIGVDPPDVVKTQPCARRECWIDPSLQSPTKSLVMIGNGLQAQYERWQPRARYRQCLDPTGDDVKKLCASLRRNAKDERVLFHYNGHGVPKPTAQGEIWVFNKAYTQYIPLSVYDLQTWMGAPSLYVYDCSNAGMIVEQFKAFAEQHERDYEMSRQNSTQGDGSGASAGPPSFKNCIQLAACAANQILPMNAELPADLFTACLTTPIKMALKWFVMQNHSARITPPGIADLIDKIPGQLSDRRTMIGELNWIFTAITDTIAWNTLSPDLFQQLFRADLLTASLCRNFLLADRVLRCYNCTPVCSPAMPSMAGHPMWQAWEQTLDLALAQLPGMLDENKPYVHSPFFEEQLTAFQVWLDLGSPVRSPPDQLPMVLQVLLCTMHRVRALEILSQFLGLGPWAVNLILSVGIFPYMVKLLQTSAKELRPLLVFIWAKIMAVDGSCQIDLVNAKGHKYFISVLQDSNIHSRTMAAFVLAGIVDNYLPGQEAALQGSLISICLVQLNEPNPLLRQWLAICLGRLWNGYDQARWSGVRDNAHEKLYSLLDDPVPEVRAAAVYALGTFISSGRERTEHANNLDQQVAINLAHISHQDMSPIVRAELLAALQWLILIFEPHFIAVSLQEGKTTPQMHHRGGSRERNRMYSGGTIDAAQDVLDTSTPPSPAERMKRVSSSSSITSLNSSISLQGLPNIGYGSVYVKLWKILCSMCTDPHPTVAKMCNEIVNHIRNQALEMSVICLDGRFTGGMSGSGGTPGSSSLPPSPNTRASYIHEHARTLPLPVFTRRKGTAGMPVTITEDPGTSPNGGRASSGSDTAKTPAPNGRIPIVTTNFVSWATSHFADCAFESQNDMDIESRMYQEKQWRYIRNGALRREARYEQSKTPIHRLESQVFNIRTPYPPSVTIFHPYDQHLAVAYKYCFGVWDWGTGAKLWQGQLKESARLTALQYVNAHDAGQLLLCGTSCGSVLLYRAASSSPTNGGGARGASSAAAPTREPRLVTAWRALGDAKSQLPAGQGSARQPGGPGLVMEWQQHTQTLVVAGAARFLRVWDAGGERKLADIPTNAECAATCLSRSGRLAACGFVDGSLRLWDTRTNQRVGVVLRDHQNQLLQAHLSADGNTLVSGCEFGEIRVYDIRSSKVLSCIQTSQCMTAMAAHQYEDVLACGFANQHIEVYNKGGTSLNVIKFHEGFMGSRIGPVSCLSFHPERCALAVGAKDSTASIYTTDTRR